MDCSDCVISRGWQLCGNWRNHSCRNHPRCVLSLCSRIGNAGSDNVKEIPHLVALSKRMMTTIKINLSFSLLLNFVAIILAMIGTLSPVWGALVHNGGSFLVVANSALLLRWAYKFNYIVDDDHSVLMNAARKRVFEA